MARSPRHYVIAEYSNGTVAHREDRQYYVRKPDGEKIDIPSAGLQAKRVRLVAAMVALFGDVPMVDDPDLIPVDIAVAGNPAIASYLYAVHIDSVTWDARDEIGEIMDVDPDTVSKYWSRFLSEVADQREYSRWR